ncbi:NAD-dependent epimerase/dehydratase family protein [Saccharopolyspora sp. HNM0983]|uniref:NAD-dependent epimerase/dehydratase family protein n=1 Tax=Saccharopolyspora montiporae TaxID=2781240 RepID=A0A929FXF7_9PSEU|nr:NAD-dependent epimerase/dehydratase family protein [Saccharopolyspora sp. HNM0983]MBE9374631.1 NAD-dependent epimerase/dehydratase family protein [Saccharopolyspora sp. HNM0983]
MRVLVTGAGGYLGRAVVRQLVAGGHRVSALVHRTPVAQPDVELFHGDVLDPEAVLPAVRGADAVVHLAGQAGSAARPAWHYRLNVGGAATVLDALTAAAAAADETPAFLLASTGDVYGRAGRHPIREDARARPRDAFADAKLAAEHLLGWAAGTGRIAAASLRVFNAAGAVDGAGDPDDAHTIPGMLAAARGRVAHFVVSGDGSAVRDFVHVLDIGSAFATALRGCRAGEHHVFNVGGPGASADRIAQLAAEQTGAAPAVVYRAGEIGPAPHPRANTAKLRRLGWRAEHSDPALLVREQAAAR